ncbi:MAG: hypothetical protein Q8R07_05960, partial [Candidatus Uhrbacteria bacterium]|nr:hypothetical protein [Candidatus Uhrbacteria bacterium]
MSPKLTQKQKFSKKTFGFFKFTAIFIMVAVLVFSNLAPSALKYFGAEKLAEHTRIKEAQAQVANDAASESHTGTTGSASEASFSWTHTPVGTPRGVLVFVTTISATKTVTSVTYGGVAMTEITAGVAIDTVTEPGRIDTFFLGSSVPTGAQTVTVNRTNNTVVMYAVAATVTAGGNTEVYTPGIVLLQENGPFAEQLVTDGSPGVNSVRYAVGYSGTAAVLAAGANSTVLNSIDFGVFTSNFARET